MPTVRPAAVAGAFYPGDAARLAADLDEMLAGVDDFAPRFDMPKALVVPHAGYIYSGTTAARAYDELRGARGTIRRVVLLGPVHRVPVRGLAVPSAESFETPLGRVPLDVEAIRQLAGLPQVVTSDPAHAMEHSIEVQLPFLQHMLGSFALVPLAVGDAGVDEVAQVLERLWGGSETLLVVSTDLSHFHAYEQACGIDAATARRIESFATDIDHDEACGATPLNGLLRMARARHLRVRRLGLCNSGDTAGGRGRVVGYASFALDEQQAVDADAAGAVLLGIARDAIARRLGAAALSPPDTPWLARPGASFVTLTSEGMLRGCIGSLEAQRPLAADVAANAEAAAFRDPRFPALDAAEWPRCEIEVSLLTTPKPIAFADEDELLESLRPGLDGLIIEHAGRRGTFLPQVWESLPDKRVFVGELKRKAGIPAETRITRCRLLRYRASKWR